MHVLSAVHSVAPDLDKVADVMSMYRRAYDTLAQSSDLSPNPSINRDLSALVCTVSQPFTPEDTHAILSHPDYKVRRQRMWWYLGQAEAAMERYYSERLEAGSLRDFLYYDNYDKLVDVELGQLGFPRKQIVMKDNESIAFVGAGPLPLSAILMHQKTGLRITCVDNDAEAVELGRKLVARCGLSSHITYRHVAGHQHDYCIHPIIFVASLVGDKGNVMHQIRKSRGVQHLAVRSVDGVHCLLYQPVSPLLSGTLNIYFDRRTQPTPDVINVTLFSTLPAQRCKPSLSLVPVRPDDVSCLKLLSGKGRKFDFFGG